MPQIINLSPIGEVLPGDSLPIFDESNGDTRRVSVSQLSTYMENTLSLPDNAADIDYDPAGTGAVQRSVQSKLRETVSVKDFGAVGDWNGTTGTDDTAAIQAAINYVQENSTINTSLGPALGPQEVYFPPGRYKISSSLLITKRISLVGERGPEYSTGARLVKTTSGDLLNFTAAGGGVSFSVDGLTLLSEVAGTGHLINVVGGSPGWNSWRVQNCCFMNPQQQAILATGDDVRIIGNTVDVSGFSGNVIQIGTTTHPCSNIIIANNDFFNIPVRPIIIYNARGVTISGNAVSQPSLNPTDPGSSTVTFVDAEDSAPVMCQALTIVGNTMYGVRRIVGLNGTTNVVISGNNAFSGGFAASEIYNAFSLAGTNTNVTISGNTISGNYGPKNFFNNSGTATNVTVTGNTITGTAAVGFACGNLTGKVNNNSVSGPIREISASDYYALGYRKTGLNQGAAYGPSVSIDATGGEYIILIANNNSAFTINAPTNPSDGQQITIQIYNATGGALGAVTWNAVFKLAAWTQPASSNSRIITFEYSSGLVKWTEVSRTGDVPN